MGIVIKSLFVLFFLIIELNLLTFKSFAAAPSIAPFPSSAITNGTPNDNAQKVKVTWTGLPNSGSFEVCYNNEGDDCQDVSVSNGKVSLDVCAMDAGVAWKCEGEQWFHAQNDYKVFLHEKNNNLTFPATFPIANYYPRASVFQEQGRAGALTVQVQGCRHPCSKDFRNDYDIVLGTRNDENDEGCHDEQVKDTLHAENDGFDRKTIDALPAGLYCLYIEDNEAGGQFEFFRFNFEISEDGHIAAMEKIKDPSGADGEPETTGGGGGSGVAGENPCGTAGGDCDTALGNIPSDGTTFIAKILEIGLGIAGAIALIFMVIGSIRVLTSSGDQQRLNGGREQIIAAIAGLLFIVFSVLILQFIDSNLINVGFQ